MFACWIMLHFSYTLNTDAVLRSFNKDFDLGVINWVRINHALLTSLSSHYIIVFHCMHFPAALTFRDQRYLFPSYFLNIGLGHGVLYTWMNFQDFMEPIVR